jgi:hypothetical protein
LNPDPEEDERQHFVNEHVYKRQVTLGTALLVCLFLAVLIVRMVLR